jgi:hypothetical protein
VIGIWEFTVHSRPSTKLEGSKEGFFSPLKVAKV